MKKFLARRALDILLPSLSASSDALHHLLAQAVRLQQGRLSEAHFVAAFDAYLLNLDRVALMSAIDFPARARMLRQPAGYKSSIFSYRTADTVPPLHPIRRYLWPRLFGLLAHLGIRLDVLILRSGAQIPPHGHSRVVSGFYVLDGEVAVRHYDRIAPTNDGMLIRPTVDRIEGPGDFSTNAELRDNIHWLVGLADESFLFRLTVLGTPTPPWNGTLVAEDRIYLDPTGSPDEAGVIRARYISAEEAQELSFHSVKVLAD